MIAIIAVNNLGFIGKENKMLWYSKEDLEHFKNTTLNRIMLVGHNTFGLLPKVVKARPIILDSRQMCTDSESIICIGGKKTYEKYCHLFTEIHISHINDNQIGDCTFPDLSNINPKCEVINYNF